MADWRAHAGVRCPVQPNIADISVINYTVRTALPVTASDQSLLAAELQCLAVLVALCSAADGLQRLVQDIPKVKDCFVHAKATGVTSSHVKLSTGQEVSELLSCLRVRVPLHAEFCVGLLSQARASVQHTCSGVSDTAMPCCSYLLISSSSALALYVFGSVAAVQASRACSAQSLACCCCQRGAPHHTCCCCFD